MPTEPSDDERSEADQPSLQAPNGQAAKSHPPFERSRFGGTQRRHERPVDHDAPVSRSDLGKGREELLVHRTAHIARPVLVISSVVILAFSIWAILMPDDERTTMKMAVDWIATNLGWYYVLTMTLVIGFVLWVALSKEGDLRIGPDHSRPQYKLVTWVSMDAFRDFHYHVAIVEAPVPMFSGRMSRETDVYYRLEVFTQTGSGGYDLMGLTRQQVIDDVLERYEARLAFLTLSAETNTHQCSHRRCRPKASSPQCRRTRRTFRTLKRRRSDGRLVNSHSAPTDVWPILWVRVRTIGRPSVQRCWIGSRYRLQLVSTRRSRTYFVQFLLGHGA